MILLKKYDYKPLERIDTPEGRRYIVGENLLLPSVTTILSATKDMTFLKEWRNAVGEDKADKIVKESTTIGNSMHQNLENYILGNAEMSGTLMAKTLAKLIIRKAFPKIQEVWGTEVALYSKGLFAGTTDLVGVHDNIPSIMDFKNSLKLKKREWIDDYFMQLTAYAMSHNEMYGTDIGRGVIMMATRDGTYQEFIIEGSEFKHYETLWINKLYAYYEQVKND
jgi:CRISPR/Cas system-associated exonuclease Cas4 (RecB family)